MQTRKQDFLKKHYGNLSKTINNTLIDTSNQLKPEIKNFDECYEFGSIYTPVVICRDQKHKDNTPSLTADTWHAKKILCDSVVINLIAIERVIEKQQKTNNQESKDFFRLLESQHSIHSMIHNKALFSKAEEAEIVNQINNYYIQDFKNIERQQSIRIEQSPILNAIIH